MKKMSAWCLLLLLANTLFAQVTNPPGLHLIRTEELKKDLYELADARFKGRSAGTTDELKAAMWMGEKYRQTGLQPAGDDGTYFQYFTLWRNHVSNSSGIQINNIPFSALAGVPPKLIRRGWCFLPPTTRT